MIFVALHADIRCYFRIKDVLVVGSDKCPCKYTTRLQDGIIAAAARRLGF